MMTNVSKIVAAVAPAVGIAALYGVALAQTGSTPREPSQSDFDSCNREAQVARGSSAGSAAGATGATGSLSGGSTLSGGSSSVTGDTSLRGITPSAQGDPLFQQAYRDCLRRRGL